MTLHRSELDPPTAGRASPVAPHARRWIRRILMTLVAGVVLADVVAVLAGALLYRRLLYPAPLGLPAGVPERARRLEVAVGCARWMSLASDPARGEKPPDGRRHAMGAARGAERMLHETGANLARKLMRLWAYVYDGS